MKQRNSIGFVNVFVGALQVYRPLEFLFTIAAFTTLAENFLPQLIALPKVISQPVSLARLRCQHQSHAKSEIFCSAFCTTE